MLFMSFLIAHNMFAYKLLGKCKKIIFRIVCATGLMSAIYNRAVHECMRKVKLENKVYNSSRTL